MSMDVNVMPLFNRYIGIDYSGAETPRSSLAGLQVYVADCGAPPRPENPPPSARKYWTRREIAEWLSQQLSAESPTIVGIDHGFSFPLAYFERHHLPRDWPTFLDDFQRHWPTDGDNTYVDFVREGACGHGAERMGDPTWLRLTEQWTATAKSVFLFDVQGSVAKSTFAGLPWLRYLRQACGKNAHFWPFDGWEISQGSSVVVEVYPSLWTRRFPKVNRNGHEQAAYCVAAWLKRADRNASLVQFFKPPLEPEEYETAQVEGWILGVV